MLTPSSLILSSFLSSGPVVAMVWEGLDVVKQVRAMVAWLAQGTRSI